MFFKPFLAVFGLLFAGGFAFAQSAIALSGGVHDTSLPVEMAADSLSIDQATRTAVFSGNARVSQGMMRLSADEIKVTYSSDQSQVQSVVASRSVLFTNGTETAESQRAMYSVDSGTIVMSGAVLLLQGPSAISGDELTLNLSGNTGTMLGNVKSVFVPQQ